jgi:hypothetical protein
LEEGQTRGSNVTGPPIIRRPRASAALSAASGDVADKRAEQPEPGTHRSIPPHKQALDAVEPKAGIARAIVVFDPWYVVVPDIPVRHSALLSRATRATDNPQAGFFYSTGYSDDCEVGHKSVKFY